MNINEESVITFYQFRKAFLYGYDDRQSATKIDRDNPFRKKGEDDTETKTDNFKLSSSLKISLFTIGSDSINFIFIFIFYYYY